MIRREFGPAIVPGREYGPAIVPGWRGFDGASGKGHSIAEVQRVVLIRAEVRVLVRMKDRSIRCSRTRKWLRVRARG